VSLMVGFRDNADIVAAASQQVGDVGIGQQIDLVS
jgi:hypothetical protein